MARLVDPAQDVSAEDEAWELANDRERDDIVRRAALRQRTIAVCAQNGRTVDLEAAS
jgi:hypothetical protein